MTDLCDSNTIDEVADTLRAHIGSTAVLVTDVRTEVQIVLANSGLILPRHMDPVMPISHSICRHVVAMNFPLMIDDAFTHPLVHGNGGVDELGISAYLGAPMRTTEGRAFGAVCALDLRRRRWRNEDLMLVLCAAQRAQSLVAATATAEEPDRREQKRDAP